MPLSVVVERAQENADWMKEKNGENNDTSTLTQRLQINSKRLEAVMCPEILNYESNISWYKLVRIIFILYIIFSTIFPIIRTIYNYAYILY